MPLARTGKPVHRMILLAAMAIALAVGWTGAAAQGGGTAHVLEIDGAIGPATSDYVSRSFADASRDGARLIVIRLDTPGGLDTSMRRIIRDILASPVPVVTWVAPSGARAASAGTFILYASHVAAMAPGTNMGAATPVQIGTGGPSPDSGSDKDEEAAGNETAPTPGTAMERKAVNDAVGYIRSLAELRGRNADWAEQAVRTGASLSANAAVEGNAADLVAADMGALLKGIEGRTVVVAGRPTRIETGGLQLVRVEPNLRTRILNVITDPNVALILMLIGIYGLIFEFMNPGALYPGVIGGISLLLGLFALAALPVSFAGVALILFGLALIAGEAFTPSFGILGLAGTAALAFGATILIDTDIPQFRVGLPVAAGLALVSVAIVLVTVRFALRSRRARIVSGREEMIGALGEVLDWKAGHGHVFVHGERWRARGADKLRRGDAIEVRAIDGLTLTIAAASPGQAPAFPA